MEMVPWLLPQRALGMNVIYARKCSEFSSQLLETPLQEKPQEGHGDQMSLKKAGKQWGPLYAGCFVFIGFSAPEPFL